MAGASNLLESVVYGRVVAGKVRRDGDVKPSEPGHFLELLTDECAAVGAGEVGAFGCSCCSSYWKGSWIGGCGDGRGEEEDDGVEMHLEGLWGNRVALRG